MSKKVSIRFIYRTQQDQEVKSVKSIHKGPIHLNNLFETYANPSYQEIQLDDNSSQPNVNQEKNAPKLQKQTSIVNQIQVNSKSNSPKKNKIQSRQTISAQHPFPEQLKSSKPKKPQSSKPVLHIEQINESELLQKQEKQNAVPKRSQISASAPPEGQIVLKSPSFKFLPKKDGDQNQASRKQYVRAEKAEKYLYSGIPQKSEDDFVGCFGCLQTKHKAYKVTNK